MVKLIFCKEDKREKNCDIALHHHSCHEMILYGRNARGETEIGGKMHEFHAGDIAIVRTGVLHSEHHVSASDVIFLGFEVPEPITEGVWSGMEHVKPLFHEIVDEVRKQEWGYERIICCKLQEILTYVGRRINGTGGSVRNLTYCRRYIEENYMQNITVGGLAKMTCYSQDRFRHLFTEEFGISPRNYLISVRLKNARELLETTQLSCLEIAQLCGFSDSGQMTKMMRREYGRTPRELRRGKETGGNITI